MPSFVPLSEVVFVSMYRKLRSSQVPLPCLDLDVFVLSMCGVGSCKKQQLPKRLSDVSKSFVGVRQHLSESVLRMSEVAVWR